MQVKTISKERRLHITNIPKIYVYCLWATKLHNDIYMGGTYFKICELMRFSCDGHKNGVIFRTIGNKLKTMGSNV